MSESQKIGVSERVAEEGRKEGREKIEVERNEGVSQCLIDRLNYR